MLGKQAFNGIVDISFNVGSRQIPIEAANVIYIMIENNYVENVLPVIYMSLSVNNTLYNNIMEYQNTGKFYLNIRSDNVLSATSLAKNAISGTFNYVPSTTNPNYAVDLSPEDNQNYDDSYRTIAVGLVSDTQTAELRKSFNGVYDEVDTQTLISMALEGTKTIAEQPEYTENYEQLIVPPLTSRYQMLQYVFEKDPYYDTDFTYFMDFDTSYLLANNGEAVSGGAGLADIIIDVRRVTEDEAMIDGVTQQNGAYYVYVNASDTNITVSKALEQVADKIVAYDDGLDEAQELDITNIGGTVSLSPSRTSSADSGVDSDKRLYLRTSAGNLYKNDLENSGITLEIVKQNIDGSIFTPDKQYMVRYYDDSSKYNGIYRLVYKRTMYKSSAGEFVMTCNLGLQKITQIAEYGLTNDLSTGKSEAVSNSARRTSTHSEIFRPYTGVIPKSQIK